MRTLGRRRFKMSETYLDKALISSTVLTSIRMWLYQQMFLENLPKVFTTAIVEKYKRIYALRTYEQEEVNVIEIEATSLKIDEMMVYIQDLIKSNFKSIVNLPGARTDIRDFTEKEFQVVEYKEGMDLSFDFPTFVFHKTGFTKTFDLIVPEVGKVAHGYIMVNAIRCSVFIDTLLDFVYQEEE